MNLQPSIFIGGAEMPPHLQLRLANRHGLIAGATGTGKTVSLRILAEGFAANGVPVFLADVKGDLSGIALPGSAKPFLTERAAKIGLEDYHLQGFPTVFWDLYGEAGHPIRTTISEMGPLLLARLLGLNDAQEGVLNIAFEVADDEGLLLLDLKDLRAILNFVGENARSLTTAYGNVSRASVGAVQRGLLALEREGGENFFGEPALELGDFLHVDRNGYGTINVLAADKLIRAPKLYATLLLWMLSELFEELPEVGDPEKPKLVFFFDEAHLLFDDAPKALLEKVTQVVRLIRSKGVGVYFVSQSPSDIPDEVLGQLGNRIQHALRAFTPKEAKAVKVAANTFRPNPGFDASEVITELAVGEALISTLEPRGVPGIVQRTLVRPPCSQLDPASPSERQSILATSPLRGKYETARDRESAYEMLQERARATGHGTAREVASASSERDEWQRRTRQAARTGRGSSREGVGEAFAKSVVRTIGRQVGRELLRGLLGTMRRGR
jgi:hypothetical protein